MLRRGVSQRRRLVGLGKHLGQDGLAHAAAGHAHVVEHERAVSHIGPLQDGVQQFRRTLEILFGTFQDRQGQSIPCAGRLSVPAVGLEELAESLRGHGVVLLVVRAAGAAQDRHGGLVRNLRLRGQGRDRRCR
jgi:hypothetical protein